MAKKAKRLESTPLNVSLSCPSCYEWGSLRYSESGKYWFIKHGDGHRCYLGYGKDLLESRLKELRYWLKERMRR
ncbi:MAG: hypothetical protein N3H31_05280 [Candidatus Nezhaarchaeota archaeon]|nr:hypothetical protein [Candidatus Nezhaarchaeota archaeon]